MSRCRICGEPDCNAQHAAQSTAGDVFDSLLTKSLETPPRPNSGDSPLFGVWVSARLDYFRAPAESFPPDIGLYGLSSPPDGSYRRLDSFWLAWLHTRVERLSGVQKAEGRARLRDIITEAMNAGAVPESLGDPRNWPRIVPAGYEPPFSEISTKFWPLRVADFAGLR